jgi:DNA repair protein RadA/Sms
LPRDLIVFGELGLTGEVRPVANGQERLREAAKHGFKRALIPAANQARPAIKGMQVEAVATLADGLDRIAAMD